MYGSEHHVNRQVYDYGPLYPLYSLNFLLKIHASLYRRYTCYLELKIVHECQTDQHGEPKTKLKVDVLSHHISVIEACHANTSLHDLYSQRENRPYQKQEYLIPVSQWITALVSMSFVVCDAAWPAFREDNGEADQVGGQAEHINDEKANEGELG